MVMEAAIITTEGSGLSEMDPYGWRQMLVSRDYGEAGNDFCKAVASLIRKICINSSFIFVTINGIKIGITQ